MGVAVSSEVPEKDIAEARERLAWAESPEQARVRRTRRALLYSLGFGAVAGAFFGWLYAATSSSISVSENQNKYIVYGASIGIGICLYSGVLVFNGVRARARREFRDRRLLGQAQYELKQRNKSRVGPPTLEHCGLRRKSGLIIIIK
jgi:hypothetical protein